MWKRILIFFVLSCLLANVTVAQDTSDFKTFQPRTARITFSYPADWVSQESDGVIALANDEEALPLRLTDPLTAGQFKVLVAHLNPEQRNNANITGTTVDEILQSVLASSEVQLLPENTRRYEFDRRLTVRADFVTDYNDGSVWVMEMERDAVVLLQVFTASGYMSRIETQVINLLRSIDLSAITKQLYAVSTLDRTLRFASDGTRLVFNYPEGWTVTESDETTIFLNKPAIQISVQYDDYTDLSLQGVPIDDPAAILASRHSRSSRPDVFGNIQQVSVNNTSYPYSWIQGDGVVGISMGRDIKVGFLWVTLLATGDSFNVNDGALAWSLLLTTTFRVDPVTLTERVIMPQHQFEFFYPQDWLIREVNPSAYLLGTSEAMTDNQPDSLQFTDEAQLFIQYVTPAEYTVARAGTTTPMDVLSKFITSTSTLTSYDTPRRLLLGNFEFAQVDFDNPNYSGTALLAPMSDGGAVWIQLRTPPNELGEWEPIALAIARNARIVTTDRISRPALDDAVFDVLGVQPTPIPTATRSPDAPADLSDVLQDVVSTPVPITVRELNFELPALTSTYITNISELSVQYPAGWLVQEGLPLSEPPRLFENSIRLANNSNLLLSQGQAIQAGDAEIVVQYMPYAELDTLGLRGDDLLSRVQRLVSAFPQGTFEAPLQLRINGELVVMVVSVLPERQTVSIYRAVENGYITAQLSVNPDELNVWLPTVVAILQSATVGAP